MMSTVQSLSFAFIPADEFGRPEAGARKLIRSHCMTGKNTKPQSRKRGTPRASTKQATAAPKDSSKNETTTELVPKGGKSTRSLPLLSPPPTDLALVRFAGEEIDRSSLELVFKFYTQGQHAVYPPGLYVDFDYSKTNWFIWLYQDAAYLQSALFTASAMTERLQGKPFGKKTFFYLTKAMACLSDQLSKPVPVIPDSTVFVVLFLVFMADVLGDQRAVETHADGLRQMVRARGGIESFRHDIKLYMKLSRVDLAYCLSTGEFSQFSPHDISWDPIFLESPFPPDSTPSVSITNLVDPRLAQCFVDLQRFAAAVNAATPDRPMPSTVFQGIVSSIQYRLIALQETLADFLAECLRLGMLAFLTTTFQMPGNVVRYPYLARRFRDCYRAVEKTPELADLVRWLLVIGAVSVCGPEEAWLRAGWAVDVAGEEKQSWGRTRERLRDVMWIDGLHDEPGRAAFEALNSSGSSTSVMELPIR